MIEFSSKGRFLGDSEAVRIHREMVTTALFNRAAEVALNQYSSILTAGASPEITDAAARFHKLAGAREFLGVFINLGERASTAAPTTVQNLKQTS